MEYAVQYANYASKKIGDELRDETMSLEEARAGISKHATTACIILRRDADPPASRWSLLPPEKK